MRGKWLKKENENEFGRIGHIGGAINILKRENENGLGRIGGIDNVTIPWK